MSVSVKKRATYSCIQESSKDLQELLKKCHAHAEQCNEEDLRAARMRIEILRDRITDVQDDTGVSAAQSGGSFRSHCSSSARRRAFVGFLKHALAGFTTTLI